MLVNPEVRPCLCLPESVHVVARHSEITKVRYTAQSPSLSLVGVFYVSVIRPRGSSGCGGCRPTNNPFLFSLLFTLGSAVSGPCVSTISQFVGDI